MTPFPEDPPATQGFYDTRGGQTPLPEPSLPVAAPAADHPGAPDPGPEPPEDGAAAGASRRLRSGLGLIALALVAGVVSFLWLGRDSRAHLLGRLRAQPEVPPTLRTYYDRAIEGDASAMRMLGTMYYNGLNVPKDKAEGIRWYRKAATAGSVAAKKDLEQLGLSTTGK